MVPGHALGALSNLSTAAELNALVNAAANAQFSDIAYDDKHDVYLRVWEHLGTQVLGRFIGADGQAKGQPFQIALVSHANAGIPKVAYSRGATDDVFLVIFSANHSGGPAMLWGQLIRYTGTGPTAAAFVAPTVPWAGTSNFPATSVSHLANAASQVVGDVIFNPELRQFFVVWQDQRAGDVDVRGRLFGTNGGPITGDFNISRAAWQQGAPAAAYDPEHDRYMVVYIGLHPQSPFMPEIIGMWAKLLNASNLAIIHEDDKPNTGLIELGKGVPAFEPGVAYLPGRDAFVAFWTGFGGARDVVGRIVPWNFGDAGVGFAGGTFPIMGAPYNEGGAHGTYNPDTSTVLIAAMSDVKVARGVELNQLGTPTTGTYNLTTPVPQAGTFFPRVTVGPSGQFAVSFVTDYKTVWSERFQSGPPGPAPLSVTISGNNIAPIVEGTFVTWTASASGGAPPLQYKFWRYVEGTGWQMAQDWGSDNTYTWAPPAGVVAVQVWVRNSGSTEQYDSYAGSGLMTVQSPLPRIATFTADRTFPAPFNVGITWTATSLWTSSPVEYQFYRYTPASGWTLAQAYSSNNTYFWYPPQGTIALQVWMRRVGSTAPYDDWKSTGLVTIVNNPARLSGITVTGTLPLVVGGTATWTAVPGAGGGAQREYKFLLFNSATGAWSVLRDYGSSNQVSWTPTAAQVGHYLIQAWVRNVGSAAAYEDWRPTPYFGVTGSTALTITTDKPLVGLRHNTWVTFTANATGGTGSWEYAFWSFNGSSWSLQQPFTLNDNTFEWAVSAGTRAVQVWIRSPGSGAAWERWQSTGLFVVNP